MKNIKNWKLVAGLGVLLLIFAAVKVFRSPRLERSLPEQLVEIDSAEITQVIINPAKERSQEIQLVRAGNKWEIRTGDRTGRLEQGGALTVLRALKSLRPERMVSKKKEKWNDFSVGDSTGTRVRAMAGTNVQADLWLGRTEYSQGGANGMSFSGFTYARLTGEGEVFAVNGFLDAQFNRPFNDWLDKTYARLKPDSVTRITFRYPADSSFVLEKKDKMWSVDGTPVDSVTIQSYLRGLEYKNLATIVDSAPVGNPQAVITLDGKSGSLAKFEGWPQGEVWILGTSYQPGTFFSSKGSDALKEVWKGKKSFVKEKTK